MFPDIFSCDHFWKLNLRLETIFEQKFSSGNHVSEHFLVPVMDFHINFFSWNMILSMELTR